MNKIINMTPHAVTIVTKDGEVIKTFPKGEVVPRLSQSTQTVDEVMGIPITETKFGECMNLPDAMDGIYLIVSRLILAANSERTDLLVPNQVVRDGEGNIIGCSSLARN